jgi:hypothetical protein
MASIWFENWRSTLSNDMAQSTPPPHPSPLLNPKSGGHKPNPPGLTSMLVSKVKQLILFVSTSYFSFQHQEISSWPVNLDAMTRQYLAILGYSYTSLEGHQYVNFCFMGMIFKNFKFKQTGIRHQMSLALNWVKTKHLAPINLGILNSQSGTPTG